MKNSNSGQGFVSDVENWVTAETNEDLTKENKGKDITESEIVYMKIVIININMKNKK